MYKARIAKQILQTYVNELLSIKKETKWQKTSQTLDKKKDTAQKR